MVQDYTNPDTQGLWNSIFELRDKLNTAEVKIEELTKRELKLEKQLEVIQNGSGTEIIRSPMEATLWQRYKT